MSEEEFEVIVQQWDTVLEQVIEEARHVRQSLNDIPLEEELQDNVEQQLERLRYDMQKIITPAVGHLRELIAGYVNQEAILRERRIKAECAAEVEAANRKVRIASEAAQMNVSIVRAQMADCERKCDAKDALRQSLFERRVAAEVHSRLYGPIPDTDTPRKRAIAL